MNASLDRREFLKRASVIGGGVMLSPAILAACGSDAKTSTSATGTHAAGPGGSFKLGTWPLYIGNDDAPNKTPTIKAFTAATGTKVNYTTDVDDNSTFTATLEPKLKAHETTGYDVVVLTSWMCDQWIKKGWASTFDDSLLPNKKNLLARHANPSWDPGRAHTLPYAEGQVGIAYYPDEVGFEIKSVHDLLDPRIKGKVTILSEMRDCLGLFMLADGLDPSKASVADAKQSLATIKKARDKGQFRKVTGNSYTDDLGSKDAIAAMAWSGDVVALQKQDPSIKWVLPDAGAMSFVDTMMIPVATKNVAQAHAWMNFLYDPKVSGPLFESISYVSPVQGANAYMSAAAQKNPLIVPPANAKIYEFRELSQNEADDLENAYTAATQL